MLFPATFVAVATGVVNRAAAFRHAVIEIAHINGTVAVGILSGAGIAEEEVAVGQVGRVALVSQFTPVGQVLSFVPFAGNFFPIGKGQFAAAVANIIGPLAAIDRTIGVKHHTFSFAEALTELPFVAVAIGEEENAAPFLFPILPGPLIAVAIGIGHDAAAVE